MYMCGKLVGFYGWNLFLGLEKWLFINFWFCVLEIGLERLLKVDKIFFEIEGYRSLDFGCRKRKKFNINY